jgi:hypothetical protein
MLDKEHRRIDTLQGQQVTFGDIPTKSLHKQHIHKVPLTTPVNISGLGAGGYPHLKDAYGDTNGKCTQQYVERRCHETL